MTATKQYRLRITVRVQGVYFRESTKAVADQLKIKGWVKNEADGSVSIEAEGPAFWMEQFLEWCAEGPEEAIVENIETEELDSPQHFTDFVVRKT